MSVGRGLLRPPASRSLAAPEESRLGVSVRLRQKPTSDVETTAQAAETTPAPAAARLRLGWGFFCGPLWFLLLSSAGRGWFLRTTLAGNGLSKVVSTPFSFLRSDLVVT